MALIFVRNLHHSRQHAVFGYVIMGVTAPSLRVLAQVTMLGGEVD